MASQKPDQQLTPASDRRVPWALVVAFLILAANFALCVHRAEGDRGAVAFAAFSFLNLILLFWCVRQFESSPPGSAARGRTKAAVWLLATSLTAVFTWKVAALMPLPLAVTAWVMAAVTVGGGFYGFFVHEEK